MARELAPRGCENVTKRAAFVAKVAGVAYRPRVTPEEHTISNDQQTERERLEAALKREASIEQHILARLSDTGPRAMCMNEIHAGSEFTMRQLWRSMRGLTQSGRVFRFDCSDPEDGNTLNLDAEQEMFVLWRHRKQAYAARPLAMSYAALQMYGVFGITPPATIMRTPRFVARGDEESVPAYNRYTDDDNDTDSPTEELCENTTINEVKP
jgi:hypothetical protein